MLTLQILPGGHGVGSYSAFSLKALALLAMSGLEFGIERGDPRKAPMKKLPVLKDGDTIVADSDLIQQHLKSAHGFDPDAGLTDQQRAETLIIRRMVENHLYFVGTYSRWMDNPETVRDMFFDEVPGFIRPAIFALVRRQVQNALYGFGLGRHNRDTIYDFGKQDVLALATRLGDGPWFFGDAPHSIDAVVYATIKNIANVPIDSPLADYTRHMDNLNALVKRFDETFDVRGA